MEEAGEGAVELAFVAGLVAEEEIEGATGVGEVTDGEGGAGGGVVDGDGVVHGGGKFHLMGDAGGFHGPDALLPPPGGDHFFDEGALGGGAGLVLFHEVVIQLVEELGHFAREDDGAGEEAVANGVERRVVFAAGGNRSTGFGAVGAGGSGTAFGSLAFHLRLWSRETGQAGGGEGKVLRGAEI